MRSSLDWANDVGGVQAVVTDTASTLLSNAVVLISTVIAMTVLSWPLTVLSLGMTPVFVCLSRKVGQARRVVSKSTQVELADLSALSEEPPSF